MTDGSIPEPPSPGSVPPIGGAPTEVVATGEEAVPTESVAPAGSALRESANSELDLTQESADTSRFDPTTKTIAQQREDTRKAMAIALLIGLAVVVVGWAATSLWADSNDVVLVTDTFRTVFTGMLGLTGTVVGFYFGGGGGGGASDG